MNLASTARSALGSNGVVLFERPRDAPPAVIEADGAPDEVVAGVLAALTGNGPRPPAASGAFSHVVVRECATEAGAAGICALTGRRRAIGYRRADAFARHAAVMAAARRYPRAAAGEAHMPQAFERAILSAGDLVDLHRLVLEDVGVVLGATKVGLLLWDDEQQGLLPAPGAFGVAQEASGPAHAANEWCSSATRVFASGTPYLANDAGADPGVLEEAVDAFDLRRLLTVPLETPDRRIGVLQLADKPTPFTLADLHAAVRIAGGIAIALVVVRDRLLLARRQRLEALLGALALDIAAGRSLQDFLGGRLDALIAAVDAAIIALVPTDGRPLVWPQRALDGDLERLLLAEAREALAPRAYAVPPRRADVPGLAVMHVPVVVEAERVATLSVLRRRGEPFDRDEREAIARLGELVALASTTERYQRRLAESARVAERRRVADELHDNVAQLLFASQLTLDAAAAQDDLPEAAAVSLDRAKELVSRAEIATRDVLQRVAPMPDDSLEERLRTLVASIEEEFARTVQLEIAADACDAAGGLGRASAALLLRTAREALVNAAKHAGPCQITVGLSAPRAGRVRLAVADHGVGFTRRRSPGYGLAAVRRAAREHGGSLRVERVRTGGTKVVLSLPV